MQQQRYAFGEFVLDVGRQELLRNGERIDAERRVLGLLALLLERRGEVVSKDEILEALWPDTATTESSLTRVVSVARAALGDHDRSKPIVRTLYGRGYQMATPVDVLGTEAGPVQLQLHPYVGRHALRDSFSGWPAGKGDARGRAVLFTGESGIGKTATVEWVLRRAIERGVEVHRGACADAKCVPPALPCSQIARSLLDASAGNDRSFREALSPLLRERASEAPRARSSAEGRLVMLEEIARRIADRARERPLGLLVEDLQWADEPTALLFEFVARQCAVAPILLLGTVCEREPSEGHAASRFVERFSRSAASEHVVIKGLTPSESVDFIKALTSERPSEEAAERLRVRTGGNPFFLREVVRSRPLGEPDSVPSSVRAAIGARLRRLSAGTREILDVVAVCGEPAASELVAIATRTDGTVVEKHALEAQEAALLEVSESGELRFPHDLIRESVSAELQPGRRIHLHTAIGNALEALHHGDLEHWLPQLAHHFGAAVQAREAGRAVDYAIRASRFHAALLGFEAALLWSTMAIRWIDESPDPDPEIRCRALRAHAEACAANDDFSGARSALEAAELLAEASCDDTARG